VLIGLAVAIATVVVPAIISLVASVAPIILTFLAVVAVVAALRAAWESDWQGIRTSLTAFWENTAKPVLEMLMKWLGETIPKVIDFYVKSWKFQISIMQQVWAFIRDNIFPVLQNLAAIVIEVVGAAITKLTEIWNTVLFPALEMIWSFIQENVIPIFELLADIAELVVGLAISALARIWKEVLWPALEKVWKFIKENVIPIFLALKTKIDEDVKPILKWLGETILPVISAALETVAGWIQWVIDKLVKLKEWLEKTKEAWESSGIWEQSPSIVESALRHIGEAVHDLARVELPALEASLGIVGTAAGATAGAGGGEGGGTSYTFSMTVQPGEFDAGDVIMGYEQMRALVGA
jgi:phage-related protein